MTFGIATDRQTDRLTDGQTESDAFIRAHRALAQVGSKITRIHRSLHGHHRLPFWEFLVLAQVNCSPFFSPHLLSICSVVCELSEISIMPVVYTFRNIFDTQHRLLNHLHTLQDSVISNMYYRLVVVSYEPVSVSFCCISKIYCTYLLEIFVLFWWHEWHIGTNLLLQITQSLSDPLSVCFT